ncbi:MAG: TrmH family RNA methyltransferase [Bacteroidia bacterium]|nr:TrmH family RNA methyltransferase [Bacteroidia bacterium]
MLPLSKAKLKLFASLTVKKYRHQHRMFIVEGEKMCREAITSGWPVEALIVRQGEAPDQVHPDIPFFEAQEAEIRQLSSQQHPEGWVAIVRFPDASFEKPVPAGVLPPGRGILLDQITDPGNLGTILRLADWFGINWVIASPDTVDWLNPKALRSSMGAVFRVKFQYAADWPSQVAAAPHRVWVADMNGEDLRQVIPATDTVILIGNEARGVSASVRALNGVRRVTIPRIGGAESLNAATATAILVWHLQTADKSQV